MAELEEGEVEIIKGLWAECPLLIFHSRRLLVLPFFNDEYLILIFHVKQWVKLCCLGEEICRINLHKVFVAGLRRSSYGKGQPDASWKGREEEEEPGKQDGKDNSRIVLLSIFHHS